MTESIKNTEEEKKWHELIPPYVEAEEAPMEHDNIIHSEKEAIDTINEAIESNKISDSDKENLKDIRNNLEQTHSEFSRSKQETDSKNLTESNEIINNNSDIKVSENKPEVLSKLPEDKSVKKDTSKSSGGGGGGLFSGLSKIGNFVSKGISKLFFILGIPIALGSGIVQTAKKIEKKDEKKK